jgi:hypothetical protein
MVSVDKAVDYAAYELQVKHLLKEVHNLLLKGDWKGAASTIDMTIVELRLMRTAVKSQIKNA